MPSRDGSPDAFGSAYRLLIQPIGRGVTDVDSSR